MPRWLKRIWWATRSPDARYWYWYNRHLDWAIIQGFGIDQARFIAHQQAKLDILERRRPF